MWPPPEIVLLYKAARTRPKDETDLEATLPHLDRPARRWLAAAIAATQPRHPWIARVGSGKSGPDPRGTAG